VSRTIDHTPEVDKGGTDQARKGDGGDAQLEDIRPPEFSDDALALRFADQRTDDLRHVDDWSKWLRWDGMCWQFDKTRAVFSHSRVVCRAAAAECNKVRLAKELASAKTVAAVVALARCDRLLVATVEQWDAQPWLFNTGGQDE
jgi:putative DNA primase/helicase